MRQCWGVVKETGVFLSIVSVLGTVRPVEGNDATKLVTKARWFLVEPLGKNLLEISALIDAGVVRPLVDSIWELEEFEMAFARLEEGHAQGKIIIKVDGMEQYYNPSSIGIQCVFCYWSLLLPLCHRSRRRSL